MSLEGVGVMNVSVSWKLLMVVCMAMERIGSSYLECEYKGIFNFGDSNTDTGGLNAVFPGQTAPYGMTFFNKPVGRASDGRLILDFLVAAEGLGLPYLSPYLQSIGSDFKHGANFATSASTVVPPLSSYFVSGLSPFPLPVQLRQMKQFKAEVDEFHQHGTPKYVKFLLLLGIIEAKKISLGTNLPDADIFGKSIYMVYIGQNDFTSKLSSSGILGLKDYSPQIISQISDTIKELYGLGGRTFMVLNMAPVGCYPRLLVELPHEESDIDEFGCMASINRAVNDYNSLLKQSLRQTKDSLPQDASLIYVDSHSALLDLFHHPTSHGLQYGTRACCGHGGGKYNFDPKAWCGNMAASACGDPHKYVSWDGVHATEAANRLVARAILNGSVFDPPFPLHQHCHLQHIA